MADRNEPLRRELAYKFGTLADACAAVQLDPSTFSRLLNGRARWTRVYWKKFVDVLGSDMALPLIGPEPAATKRRRVSSQPVEEGR